MSEAVMHVVTVAMLGVIIGVLLVLVWENWPRRGRGQ
jgi:hypothetical protein